MIIKKAGMAYIGKVIEVFSIENADNIQKTRVVCGKGGIWTGVTTKEIKKDDIVVVFLPDAIVPKIDSLAFMKKRKWKVTPCKLRGCPSEVLIVPISQFDTISSKVGTDVTYEIGVQKYEKEFPISLSGDIFGNFPLFIPKTDEPNFQAVLEFREALRGKAFYITEKYDGTSVTIYYKDGHFGVCSRNFELKKSQKSIWQIVEMYDLENELPKYGNYALQMEVIGPKIQKNPLNLSSIDARIFDVWNIDTQEYVDFLEALQITKELGMKFVTTINEIDFYPNYTDEELRKLAEGNYIGTNCTREGIVIRPIKTMRVEGKRLSFKVINLCYKER